MHLIKQYHNSKMQEASRLASSVELTIAVLQDPSNPTIRKPRLSLKHLSRPPFRYLHAIISSVQCETGFAPGLYGEGELDAKSLQDKEAKVSYLIKMINVVSVFLREPVPANPFKMVAGLEPENTNVFLQMLGKACTLGNAADIVEAVLYHEHCINQQQYCGGHYKQEEEEEEEEGEAEVHDQQHEGSLVGGSNSNGAAHADTKLTPGLEGPDDAAVGCLNLPNFSIPSQLSDHCGTAAARFKKSFSKHRSTIKKFFRTRSFFRKKKNQVHPAPGPAAV